MNAAPKRSAARPSEARTPAPKARAQDAGSAIHEQVYGQLRQAIISGQLEPGQALSVRRLSARFNVSAMPVRVAIRQLVATGALEMTATRRVKIARMTEERLDEISSARTALEPELAIRALARVQNNPRKRKKLVADLREADWLLAKAIKQGDIAAYAQSNYDFHFTLYRAAEAHVLLGLVENLWLQFGPFMRVVIGRLGTSVFLDDGHQRAIEALDNLDAGKLADAIRADINQGSEKLSAVDFAADY
ncbi:MAG: GntR family transcriptional regulator [Parvularculaceae bacterium]